MRFGCSEIEDALSLLRFRSIAAYSSSDSTVIFRSLGLEPPA